MTDAMTAAAAAAEPPGTRRLLWLNGPYCVGKRTLAQCLRDHWQAIMLDAEELGLVLQQGLPPRLPPELDPGDLQDLPAWHRAIARVGTDLAHMWRPLVVMPATLYNGPAVTRLLERFRRSQVDVLHVVLTCDEVELRARINNQSVDRDAKRWAIQHLRPAVAGLSDISDAVQLDTTGRPLDQLVYDLAAALRDYDWLAEDGRWTTHLR